MEVRRQLEKVGRIFEFLRATAVGVLAMPTDEDIAANIAERGGDEIQGLALTNEERVNTWWARGCCAVVVAGTLGGCGALVAYLAAVGK